MEVSVEEIGLRRAIAFGFGKCKCNQILTQFSYPVNLGYEGPFVKDEFQLREDISFLIPEE